MSVLERFSTNWKTDSNPVSIKPNEYSSDVPLVCWLFLFATIGFTLYESLQSFLSTGRIWPVIFILVILLLLGNSYLEMKQRKHWVATLPEHYSFSSEIQDERHPLQYHSLALAIRRIRRYFKLERDCGV
jgi:hypothetical protein